MGGGQGVAGTVGCVPWARSGEGSVRGVGRWLLAPPSALCGTSLALREFPQGIPQGNELGMVK